MSDEVSLRPGRLDDLEVVRRIAADAYAPYTPRIGRPAAPVSADYEAHLRRGEVTLAERAGVVVGLLVLLDREGHLLLDNVAVDPAEHGSGVGSRLLAHADDVARERGHDEVRLYTNEAMTENLGYYPRRGYVETHREVDDGYRRVFFTKRLR